MLMRQTLSTRLGLGTLRVPGGAWVPAALVVIGILAFWRSALASLPLLGADSPAGLAPMVPFLAAWLAGATVAHRLRRGRPVVGPADEGAIDVPIGLLLLTAAGWLIWKAPDRFGWYYWTYRLDLLALPLFIVGAGVIIFGLQTVLYYKFPILFSFLIWPEPLVRLHEATATPLARLSAVFARPLAQLLGAHLMTAGPDVRVFTHATGDPWTMVVGDVCAGLNAALTVGLVSIPAAAHFGLTWKRALPWIFTGLTLAVVCNVVRIAAILGAADKWGVPFAMGTLHPILGAVLLGVVFLVLWLIVPADQESRSERAKCAVVQWVPVPGRALLCVPAAVGIFAVGSAGLAQYEPLPPVGPPGGVVSAPIDYFRLPAGWTVEQKGTLAAQNLFGRDSEAYWLNLRSPEGARVYAQLVATPDRGRLRSYTLEACQVYHGSNVVGTRTVSLGTGGVATLIDTWDRKYGNAGRMSLAYWEAPFAVNGREMHARLALFATQPDERLLPVQSGDERNLAPGGAQFERMDGALVTLARGMTREILNGAVPSTASSMSAAPAALPGA